MTVIHLSFPDDVKDLVELLKAKEVLGRISIYLEKLRISTTGNFYIEVAVKDVVGALSLALPSWARPVKEVERVVERIPKSQINKCSTCEKSLTKIPEVILLYDGAKILGSFCSTECETKWRSKIETTGKEDEAK